MSVALQVENLTAHSLDVDRMEVSWEVRETTEDTLDYTFQVLRSESGGGPFEKMGLPFEDKFLFIDSRIPGPYKWRTLYYKLIVTRKADSTTAEFGPVASLPEPSLDAQAMRLNEQVLFSQVVGRRCWVFPVRTFGTRCPFCWDAVMNQRTVSMCIQCFDTSYLRGFHDPIASWVQIDPTPREDQIQAINRDHQNATTGRMSYFPKLKPDDLLVEHENRRWRVVKVTPTERLRAVIHQELIIREIQPTDVEYKVPINLERAIQDEQPSPPRMFSNPVNLDALIDERTPNVFALYETDPKSVEE